jgi:spermidine synthase
VNPVAVVALSAWASAAPPTTAAASPSAPVVVFNEKSPYAHVYVVDEGPLRALRFTDPEGDDQSIFDKSAPDRVVIEYVRAALAATALVPTPSRVLVVGLGAGSYPRALLSSSKTIKVDAVEIDRVVVKVARRFFGLKPDPRLQVFIDDAALHLPRSRARYDVILLDAYGSAGIPEALRTHSFFKAARDRLKPGGLVLANVALLPSDEQRALIEAFAASFDGCVALRPATDDNVILVGSAVRQSVPAVRAALKKGKDPAAVALVRSCNDELKAALP